MGREGRGTWSRSADGIMDSKSSEEFDDADAGFVSRGNPWEAEIVSVCQCRRIEFRECITFDTL